jgi:hypothetical protein
VFLVITAAGAVVLRGGYAHYEGQFFLVNYLDGRNFFDTIFSAHFNEWDCYQGRELSFLFGWLDAEVIGLSARLGWVHLYSATHFIALFAMSVILWHALQQLFPALKKDHAGLIVVLLLTSPAALFSGYYYRPAKILAAFFLVVVLSLIGRMREPDWELSSGLLVALGAAATLLGMSDRLGIYMLLLVLIALPAARRFDRATMLAMSTLLVALAVNVVWSTAIGPQLSAIADGYPPDTVDQVVRLRFTFFRGEHYAPALGLLTDHIEYFFGNFGLVSLIGVALTAALVLWRTRDRRLALVFVIVLIATTVVYVAMYARLPSLTWPASRRVYYWLPQIVVLAIACAAIVAQSRVAFPRAGPVIRVLLMVMIAGNILSISRHREAIASQEHRPWIAQSSTVRECIRETTPPISGYGLNAPYAQLCGAVRASVAGVEWNRTPSAQPNSRLYCRNSGRRYQVAAKGHGTK